MTYDECSFFLFGMAQLHAYALVAYLMQVCKIVKSTIQYSISAMYLCGTLPFWKVQSSTILSPNVSQMLPVTVFAYLLHIMVY